MVLSRQMLLDRKSHSSTANSITRATEPHFRVASLPNSKEKGSSDGKLRRQMIRYSRGSIDPLRTALHGQLLTSKHEQARSTRYGRDTQ
jgi:hypothetical protein